MGNIFYIADMHLGHSNIMRLCQRPFSSVEEMNETILNNWNLRVTNNDTVYVLGDVSFRSREDVIYSLRQLKGRKILIEGNHDQANLKQLEFRKCFDEITPLKTIYDKDRKVVLCHYPIIEWDGFFRGSYLVYGHIHNNVLNNAYQCMKTLDKALNAGVDINHFMPVTLEELIANNAKFNYQNA